MPAQFHRLTSAACVFVVALSLAGCQTTGPGAASYGSGSIASNGTGNGTGTGTGTTVTTGTNGALGTAPPQVFRTTIAVPSDPATVFSGTGTSGGVEGVVIADTSNVSVNARTAAGGADAIASRDLNNASIASIDPNAPTVINAVALGTNDINNVETPEDYTTGTSLIVSNVNGRFFQNGDFLGSSQFGFVSERVGLTERVAGFHSGIETAVNNMPTTGQANYLGGFSGRQYNIGANTSREIRSTSLLQADFAGGTVNGVVGLDPRDQNTISPAYFVQFQSTINRNTFAGTADFRDLITGAAIGTVSNSSASGGFYGAGAREIAGALRIEGNPDGTPTVVVGGFGGVMNPDVQLRIVP
ncbi:MAG: transferrin-binding protein-like solute binding protein [Pseudomonadota bacterium]